jgi:hypothetical protein
MKHVYVRFFQVLRLILNTGIFMLIKKELFYSENTINVNRGDSLLNEKALTIEIPIKFKDENLAINPTTSGRVIQCKYEIEVTSSFGRWHNPGPSIEIPVLIYSQEIISIIQPSVPEEWNPIELPVSLYDANKLVGYN